MRLELYSGAGNLFLLTSMPVPETQAPELARALCARAVLQGQRADGLLVIGDAQSARPRLTIFNADGSRPEACGNGLRCAGWHLARTKTAQSFEFSTDAGLRRTRVEEARGRQATLLVDMGPVHIAPLKQPWPRVQGLLEAFEAKLGNPHCVLRVKDERELDARAISAALELHPSFREGVNVGLLAQRARGWHLRVFERGVGETAACGSGACAAAASFTGGSAEVQIKMRGGELRVLLDHKQHAQLLGQATYHGALQIDHPRHQAHPWATCSRS